MLQASAQELRAAAVYRDMLRSALTLLHLEQARLEAKRAEVRSLKDELARYVRGQMGEDDGVC